MTKQHVDPALTGPWVATMSDDYGNLHDTVEEAAEGGGYVEIAVVRGSAAPADGRMPGSYGPADVLYRWEDSDFYEPEDVERRWVQAVAVAEALNARAGG